MTGKLDWKWIAIGVVIMVVLNLAAGLLLGVILGPRLKGAASPAEISLSGGQMLLALVVNVLSFLIGGFIVGIKSAGRTIWSRASPPSSLCSSRWSSRGN